MTADDVVAAGTASSWATPVVSLQLQLARSSGEFQDDATVVDTTGDSHSILGACIVVNGDDGGHRASLSRIEHGGVTAYIITIIIIILLITIT